MQFVVRSYFRESNLVDSNSESESNCRNWRELLSQLITDCPNRASNHPLSRAAPISSAHFPIRFFFFSDAAPNDFRTSFAKIVSKAISDKVSSLANAYLARENADETIPQLELLTSIVSFSDVLNENVADVLELLTVSQI
jgi:hypothetical protein